MIAKKDIPALVALLEDCQAGIYHACQLKDFHSYLRIGGIPSRALMESSNQEFTAFQTDARDHESDVWDKVFGNLHDFGRSFASYNIPSGRAVVPNPYGPILVVLSPSALLEADDVAICLRSAGAKGFNREREALPLARIDRLFADRHPSGARYAKFGSQLRREGTGRESDPELSASVPQQYFSLKYITHLIVDGYRFESGTLLEIVQQAWAAAGGPKRVWPRRTRPDRAALLTEVSAAIRDGCLRANELAESSSAGPLARQWACELIASGLQYQYQRFATYLQNGTLALVAAPKHVHPVAHSVPPSDEDFRTSDDISVDEFELSEELPALFGLWVGRHEQLGDVVFDADLQTAGTRRIKLWTASDQIVREFDAAEVKSRLRTVHNLEWLARASAQYHDWLIAVGLVNFSDDDAGEFDDGEPLWRDEGSDMYDKDHEDLQEDLREDLQERVEGQARSEEDGWYYED